MNHSLDLSECESDNSLWAFLLEKLGSDKAKQAIRQASDLQSMNGNEQTLPVLFIETCGVALTNYETLKNQTGLIVLGENKVLIFSSKRKSFQLLQESK